MSKEDDVRKWIEGLEEPGLAILALMIISALFALLIIAVILSVINHLYDLQTLKELIVRIWKTVSGVIP